MAVTKKSGKSNSSKDSVAHRAHSKTSPAYSKHSNQPTTNKTAPASCADPKKSDGIDEIESLFATKKKHKQQQQQQQASQKNAAAATKKTPPSSNNNNNNSKSLDRMTEHEWVDDGLGGKYNHEGYTGRVEDGVRIFKTHLLQSAKSGSTPDCPFDCDCCFIWNHHISRKNKA